MTPEPIPVLQSDSAADPILLRNIGSYPHHSESTLLPPNALSLFRLWLPMQGRKDTIVSQLCYGPVVTYYMVYHYTKRAMLARLLANEGPAIYVVHLNRYFVIPP